MGLATYYSLLIFYVFVKTKDSRMSNEERCQRCNELGQDRRTLVMACLYDMSEFKVPYNKRIAIVDYGGESSDSFSRAEFHLRVCKQCRADWLVAIERWFWEEHSIGEGI